MIKKSNKPKAPRQAHTDNSQQGMGDYYRSGIKNKIGRTIYDSVNGISSSKVMRSSKHPKTLA